MLQVLNIGPVKVLNIGLVREECEIKISLLCFKNGARMLNKHRKISFPQHLVPQLSLYELDAILSSGVSDAEDLFVLIKTLTNHNWELEYVLKS